MKGWLHGNSRDHGNHGIPVYIAFRVQSTPAVRPLQVHRGTKSAFGGDAEAQSLAGRLAARPEWVASLSPYERMFAIVLPCMHSERMELHELGDRLLREWGAEEGVAPNHAKAYAGTLGFLAEHTEVVRRFGRYPSRNAAMGRAATAEEEEYLKTEAKPWELSQAAAK